MNEEGRRKDWQCGNVQEGGREGAKEGGGGRVARRVYSKEGRRDEW